MTVHEGRIQLLSDTLTRWTANNPVLLDGEIGVANAGSMSPIFKCGDGVRPWNNLPSMNAPVTAAQDYVVGTTVTLPPGSDATVVIDNAVDPPTISFGIPRGDVGATGPPNILSVGSTTTSAPGSDAEVTITGTSPAQVLHFVIPRGEQGPQGIQGIQGPPNVLSVGTVTTGAPGSAASATITGTSPAQVLNLTIPRGDTGAQGIQGIPGPAVPLGNPSVPVGLTVKNGTGTTAMRSDAAPALDQAIVPTWSALHTFTLTPVVPDKSWAYAKIQDVSGPGVVLGRSSAGAGVIEELSASGLITIIGGAGAALTKVDDTNVTLTLGGTPATALLKAASLTLGWNGTLAVPRGGSGAGSLTGYLKGNGTSPFTAVTTIPYSDLSGTPVIPTVPGIFTSTTAGLVPASGGGTVNFLRADGTFAAPAGGGGTLADPTGLIGMSAVVGTATTGTRSDARHAIDPAIAPTWTGNHTFAAGSGAFTLASPALNDARINFSAANGTVGLAYLGCGYTTGSLINGSLAGDMNFRVATHQFNFSVDAGNTTAVRIATNNVLWANSNLVVGGTLTTGITLYMSSGTRHALDDNGDGYLRLNDSGHYSNGTYTPGVFRAAGGLRSDNYWSDAAVTKAISWNTGAGGFSYGTCFIGGTFGTYCGIGLDDVLKVIFMSNGANAAGIYSQGEAKWLWQRDTSTTMLSGYNISAPSFNATSSRKIKKETGAPSRAAEMLRRLRPIFYKLLADGKKAKEQVGLIAEEVAAICPQLSDGKTVSYDRLALLLLADWQEKNGSEAL